MKYVITVAITLKSLCLLSQTTIYVNQSVQGGQQNGISWPNAFPDLQQALAISNNGDAIWVAQGTYYPTSTTNRSISFVLKQGVKIYGGFIGTETELTQRELEQNETALSGNIGNPEGADNSYHVLYGTSLDSTTILDGFTITKGVANGNNPVSSTEWGGGLLLEPSSNFYNTCPIIQNCSFEENYALIGGAIHCPWEIGNYYVNPIIRNCQFVSNRAQQSGGAIYKSGSSLSDFPYELNNCVFTKNSAFYGNGGALFISNTENTTVIRNCLFEKDTSRFSWGGGIFYDHIGESQIVIETCNFTENYAIEGAAMCTDYKFGQSTPFFIEFSTCKFEKNKAANGLGGAVWIMGEDSLITSRFLKCSFLDNRSASYATALLIGGTEVVVEIDQCVFRNNVGITPNPDDSRYTVYIGGLLTKGKITNCVFSNNESALALFSPQNAKATYHITNCTFFQNGKYVIDKSNFPLGLGYNNCYITNSIFEDDATFEKMFSDNDIIGSSLGGYHIDHTFLSLNDNLTPNDPAFGDHVVFIATPFFLNAANNDFHLPKCSPAVNAGDNLILDTLGILTDLDGNPRVRFDTVDVGAYETQDSCFTISSKEPQTASFTAVLLPTPSSPGSPLDVHVFDIKHPKIEWIMRDTYGRALSSGSALLFEKQHFSTVAPTSPGIYFIEIRSGIQSVWLKFMVQG